MATDLPSARSAASAARLRVRWLVVIVAVMVLLTGGWQLVNHAVSNRQALTPGTRLSIGPGHGDSGQITVGSGWSLLSADSNPLYGYKLKHGAVDFSADYIRLVDPGQARLTWAGLRKLLRVTDPGVRLGKQAVITSAYGRAGITGAVSGAHQFGIATVFADPGRRFGVEIIMLAPRGTRRALLAPGLQIIRSMRMPGGSS
jgi:hypothetical protein